MNRNVAANYGPGQLDRTHRLTMNGIVELPKGSYVLSFRARAASVSSPHAADASHAERVHSAVEPSNRSWAITVLVLSVLLVLVQAPIRPAAKRTVSE